MSSKDENTWSVGVQAIQLHYYGGHGVNVGCIEDDEVLILEKSGGVHQFELKDVAAFCPSDESGNGGWAVVRHVSLVGKRIVGEVSRNDGWIVVTDEEGNVSYFRACDATHVIGVQHAEYTEFAATAAADDDNLPVEDEEGGEGYVVDDDNINIDDENPEDDVYNNDDVAEPEYDDEGAGDAENHDDDTYYVDDEETIVGRRSQAARPQKAAPRQRQPERAPQKQKTDRAPARKVTTKRRITR